MKIAAWQMPIGASEALAALSVQLRRCEKAGVSVLCCPEAAVGGLADYSHDPDAAAIETADVDATFAPIASATANSREMNPPTLVSAQFVRQPIYVRFDHLMRLLKKRNRPPPRQ